jgi:hypothetical protein
MTVVVRKGSGKSADDSEDGVTDAPTTLGSNLDKIYENWSTWRRVHNPTPPTSPTLGPLSPATVVAVSETDRAGSLDVLNPSIFSNSVHSSRSSQSASTREQLFPSPFSSPPSEQKQNSPFQNQYPPTPGYLTSDGQATTLRSAAQLTPASIIYTPSANVSRQLFAPVSPAPGPTSNAAQAVNPNSIQPLYWATKFEKSLILEKKLHHLCRSDAAAANADPDLAKNGIHVFVDLSNITICFYEMLKQNRQIPSHRRLTPAPPFFFENFALLLERDRSVMKRIVAGSEVGNNPERRPAYMQEAEACGYEMNIFQRVYKTAPPVYNGNHYRRKRRNNNTTSDTNWTTSGGDSSDEQSTGYLRRGEQGVDENLHLKIAESLLDYSPGTIVLATGDAAAAEFSDGFKKQAERALKAGWNVELYAWSSGMSSAWRDSEFSQRWEDQFRIVLLDEFAEELLGIWSD